MLKATHREVKIPSITARFLADYMAAGSRERARRAIIQGCKFRSGARLIQHNEAKAIISNFIMAENPSVEELLEKSVWVRSKVTNDPFEADVNRHNADYIARFAKIYPSIILPSATIEAVGDVPALNLGGVKVNTELQFRLRRTTKTNKTRIGGAMLRYSKGKALPADVADWQSAFLFGYLGIVQISDGAEPEQKLCVTLDAYAGSLTAAPSNSVARFKEMEAACVTIAERWPNIEPPKGAILVP